MGFRNRSKLCFKNPLEIFKGTNRPKDRENLVYTWVFIKGLAAKSLLKGPQTAVAYQDKTLHK